MTSLNNQPWKKNATNITHNELFLFNNIYVSIYIQYCLVKKEVMCVKERENVTIELYEEQGKEKML